MVNRPIKNLSPSNVSPINRPIELPSVDDCDFGYFGQHDRWWQIRTAWIPNTVMGIRNTYIRKGLLGRLSKVKRLIFDNNGDRCVKKARSLCNPFESIGSGIFMNRAAMKLAEIDSVFDGMFSKTRPITWLNYTNELVGTDVVYFADICGGPGGFSEYMLWRRPFHCKGFGITLKNEIDDFQENDFNNECHGSAAFKSFYGQDGTGDIYNIDNIMAFSKHVLEHTGNMGVHSAFADGGFSVKGMDDFQEIVSKRLYVAQCLCALHVLREGGNFMLKMFDIFTEFSIGLIFLMRVVFKRVFIYKPACSRPANAERYLVCQELRKSRFLNIEMYINILDDLGTEYFDNEVRMEISDRCLIRVIDHLHETLRQCEYLNSSKQDLLGIIPKRYLRMSRAFSDKIKHVIENMGRSQLRSLEMIFRTLKETENLDDMRFLKERNRNFYMGQWRIPTRHRSRFPRVLINNNPEAVLRKAHSLNPRNFSAFTATDWRMFHNGTCIPSFTGVLHYLVSSSICDVMFLNNGSNWVKVNGVSFFQNSILLVEEIRSHYRTVFVAVDLLAISGIPLTNVSHSIRYKILDSALKCTHKSDTKPIVVISHRYSNSMDLFNFSIPQPPSFNKIFHPLSPYLPQPEPIKFIWCMQHDDGPVFMAMCPHQTDILMSTGFKYSDLKFQKRQKFEQVNEPLDFGTVWTFVEEDSSAPFIHRCNGTGAIPMFIRSIVNDRYPLTYSAFSSSNETSTPEQTTPAGSFDEYSTEKDSVHS